MRMGFNIDEGEKIIGIGGPNLGNLTGNANKEFSTCIKLGPERPLFSMKQKIKNNYELQFIFYFI